MTVSNKKNGILFALALTFFIALVAIFYGNQRSRSDTTRSVDIPEPAYQTGKAFEVIEPDEPATLTSDKTPDELIIDAEAIIADADAIVAKHGLDAIELTPEQSRAVGERISNIEGKITGLETRLEQ